MSLPKNAYKKVDPVQLRVGYEETWTRADQAWADQRDHCRCRQPRPGPRYFKVTRCTACGYRIRE